MDVKIPAAIVAWTVAALVGAALDSQTFGLFAGFLTFAAELWIFDKLVDAKSARQRAERELGPEIERLRRQVNEHREEAPPSAITKRNVADAAAAAFMILQPRPALNLEEAAARVHLVVPKYDEALCDPTRPVLRSRDTWSWRAEAGSVLVPVNSQGAGRDLCADCYQVLFGSTDRTVSSAVDAPTDASPPVVPDLPEELERRLEGITSYADLNKVVSSIAQFGRDLSAPVYVERRGVMYRWSIVHRGGPYPLQRELARLFGISHDRLLVPFATVNGWTTVAAAVDGSNDGFGFVEPDIDVDTIRRRVLRACSADA